MTPDEVNSLTAIAQAVLSLAALIASIAVSVFVYYGTKRMTRIEFDRSIREWWNALDQLALSNDELLVVADKLFYPTATNETIDQKRRKWFTFVILNALASSHTGYKQGLTGSSADTLNIVKHHLRNLMKSEDVFLQSQSGYELSFMKLCKEIREELRNEAPAETETAASQTA